MKISFYYSTYVVYKSGIRRKQGEEHKFSPFYLVWNGDYYYVIGWSDEHNKIVQFRVDRIETIPDVLEEEAHKIPSTFRLNPYINTMFHMYDSDRQKVGLICDNSVANAIADKLGEHVKIEKIDDDTFRTKVTVAVNHIFYSWIFGFGGKVKIAGPEDVREGYLNMLKEAFNYENLDAVVQY